MRAHRAARGQTLTSSAARHARAAALTVCLLSLVVADRPALSQTSDTPTKEVPIGTFNIGEPRNGFSVVEPPAGVPERNTTEDGSNRWFFESWLKTAPADTAEQLYGEAMAALDGGRIEDAQRLFERLIAEAPRSVQAAEARRHLGRLYSSAGGTPNKSASPPAAEAQTPSQVGEGAVAAAPSAAEATLPWGGKDPLVGQRAPVKVDRPLPPTVLAKARVSPSLDGQFLAAAGDRVFFSAGSASLGMRAQSVIQAQARFLKQNPWLSAAIEGHADDGALPDVETLRLSDMRAAVVRDRLIAEGIASERLTAYGRGRDERVSDCAESACLAQNRRAITILLQGRIQDVSRIRGSASAVTDGPASQ